MERFYRTRQNASCDLGGGTTYRRARPPKPVLEAQWSGLCPFPVRKMTAQWAKRDTLMSQGKIVARQFLSLESLSRSYPHRGGNFERGKNALSCGRETFLEAFCKGNCESKLVARQWRVNFCRESRRRDIKMSRRALWEAVNKGGGAILNFRNQICLRICNVILVPPSP